VEATGNEPKRGWIDIGADGFGDTLNRFCGDRQTGE